MWNPVPTKEKGEAFFTYVCSIDYPLKISWWFPPTQTWVEFLKMFPPTARVQNTIKHFPYTAFSVLYNVNSITIRLKILFICDQPFDSSPSV